MIRDRIELYFETIARLFYRHRLKTLLFTFSIIALILFKLPALTIDTSSEAMLPEKDPAKVVYDQFRDQFGQDRLIVLTVTSDHIFTEDFLRKLKSFHHDIKERVPHLEEITSLVNARNTRGEGDRLIVEDLLDDWPGQKQLDMAEFKKRVLSNPTYTNNIISTDGRTTAVVLKTDVYQTPESDALDMLDNFGEDTFVGETDTAEKTYLSDEETKQIVAELNTIIDKYKGPDFKIAMAGAPVVIDVFNQSVENDMRKTFLVSFLGILVFLGILFRRISGMVLPAIIVNCAAFSAFGLMGWFGVSVKITSTLLPAFLLCVGVADAVHILSIFYRQIDHGASKEDAVGYAFGHTGLAVTLTTLTTAAALLSFSFADLTALAELGLFAAAGVTLALFYTIVMMPALLALTPIKSKIPPEKVENHKTVMDRILLAIADFSTRYPLRIVGISLILFAISLHFIFQLRYTEYMVDYFPDHMTIKKDVDFIDKHLKGATQLEVVIDTGQENGIYEPAILNRIEQATKYYQQYKAGDIFVGKVFSINDILKETNQALHGNQADFYAIPQDYKTIAQEFFLFENSGADDLENVVDTQFSKTRFSLKLPWVDAVVLDGFIDRVDQYFNILFADRADITITGMAEIMARTIHAALDSMTRSYFLAFAVISVMMVLLVGDVKIGLFSMIPNILPILLTLGMMGYFDVPLDMTSLLMCSIAMGLVVDDTVHFIYNFRKYYVKTGDAYESVRLTFSSVGRAMFITSVVLSYGFFVLAIGELKHGVRFGVFTGLAILFALLADFVLSPALMIIITGSLRKKSITAGA